MKKIITFMQKKKKNEKRKQRTDKNAQLKTGKLGVALQKAEHQKKEHRRNAIFIFVSVFKVDWLFCKNWKFLNAASHV